MRQSLRKYVIFLLALIYCQNGFSASNDIRIYDYDVSQYDLSLRFDVPKKSFKGSVTVTATTLKSVQEFVLSASNSTITVDSVMDNGTKIPFQHQSDHLIAMMPGIIAASSTVRLTIYYHAVAAFEGNYEGGGVYITSVNGKDCIASGSQPMFARMWWPCKDVPSDKATASITITVPSKLTAVSNGTLKNTRHEKGYSTYSWSTEYPIATYLVSIAVAEYKEFSDTYRAINGKEMSINYYVFPDDYEKAKTDFQNTSKILTFFATTFSEYPFLNEKFGYAEVVGDLTMENQTICSIEQSLITGKQENELTLVHETAHQWWGNCITPLNWNHTWLNEGFATYAEVLYLEQTKGKDAYNDYIRRAMLFRQGEFAGSVVGQTDTLFWESFSARVYFKGALVLHMLRSMIGDSEFFSIMRNYLHNPQLRYGNATTEDFIAECERVHKGDLRWFFDQWVYANTDSFDRPELYYSWTSGKSSAGYFVTINIQQESASELLYKLPFKIDVKTDDTTHTFSVTDSLAIQSFTFEVPDKPTDIAIDRENSVLKFLKRIQ